MLWCNFIGTKFAWTFCKPFLFNLPNPLHAYLHCKPGSSNENRYSLCPQGKPALITGNTCSNYRDPVHIAGNLFSKQMVPCTPPVRDCSIAFLFKKCQRENLDKSRTTKMLQWFLDKFTKSWFFQLHSPFENQEMNGLFPDFLLKKMIEHSMLDWELL